MFGNAIDAAADPKARISQPIFPMTATGLAQLAAEVGWIVVLGLLVVGWLISAHSPQTQASKHDFASECVSFGRGGARCVDRPGHEKADDQLGRANDCESLGKGGRVCFARAAVEKGTN
jgi:hypothetical protein